jgi:hypothetical protein
MSPFRATLSSALLPLDQEVTVWPVRRCFIGFRTARPDGMTMPLFGHNNDKEQQALGLLLYPLR